MKDSIKAIRSLEDEYGLPLFRMALSHLVDVGVRHLTDENVEAAVSRIKTKDKADRDNGDTPAMTAEFQIAIVECAAKLAKFNILDLFLYIKKHVHIG